MCRRWLLPLVTTLLCGCGCATPQERRASRPEVAVQETLDRFPACSRAAQRSAVRTLKAGVMGEMTAAGHLEIRVGDGCGSEGHNAMCWGNYFFVPAGNPELAFELVTPGGAQPEWRGYRYALSRLKSYRPLISVLVTGTPEEPPWELDRRKGLFFPTWMLKEICAIRP
jgi:hypothetical protein